MSQVGARFLSAQAAPHRSDELKPQKLRVSTLPNGLIVASLENYSPISRIGVFIKAGSRYEPADELGLSHTLRSVAGLSTQRSTVFGITRNLEYVGARLLAVTTRDNICYFLEQNRDHTVTNLRFLSDTITAPAFKPWELSDNVNRQKVDLAFLKENPNILVLENLHKAAFRGGLRNSLFSPDFMLGKHSQESLQRYVEDHFVSNRTAIVGLGIEHDLLLEQVESKFSLARGDRGNSGESKFIGGESRQESNSDVTYAAVVAEGVGYDLIFCIFHLIIILKNEGQMI